MHISATISAIALSLPLRIGDVNCYLLQSGGDAVLVDTGTPGARADLDRELAARGCRPGALRLIVLTHGDLDHIGNAAHLRVAYGCPVAMHAADALAAETGDMFATRQKSNAIARALVPRLMGFGKAERFTPDVLIEDGFSLAAYGLDATVIAIPGHSKGSIGVLTANGDLFCGDLFESTKGPALNSLMDDQDAALRSFARLRGLEVRTIYPGHGKPFTMAQLPQ
jgi:glyoxylase-like metal-dependent hydrolase (beta-lactamase superfamily II)